MQKMIFHIPKNEKNVFHRWDKLRIVKNKQPLFNKEENTMKLFSKKTTIYLGSEEQKDNMINKLESQHLEYELKQDRDGVAGSRPVYRLKVYAADYAKVV